MKLPNQVSPGKPFWKSRPWQIALTGFVIIAGGLVWLLTSSTSPISTLVKGTPTASYQTTTVKRGNLTISASGQGTLISAKYVDLSFLSDGVVDKLNVQTGDRVETGQVLASLDNVKSLEAQVSSDNLALLEAQKTFDDLQNNKDVSLAQAYSDYITAQEDYNSALRMTQRDEYARCSKEVNTKYNLALERAASRLKEIDKRYYGSEDWIEAKNNYDQALANYQYCISYTDDEKANYSADLDVARVTLDKAKTSYESMKAASGIDPDELALAEAQVKKAAAQYELSQADLASATLKAPFNGTITYLASNQGSMVTASTKYITISDLSRPEVEINIDETDIDKLKMGATCEIVFDALPDTTFTGKVTQINPELTTSDQIKVATAYAELDETAAKILEDLPLGLQASVSVIDQQKKDTLLVPLSALREISTGQYGVFIVNSDGSLHFQSVEVGLMDTVRAEILSGLKEGDLVSTGLSSSY